MPRVANESNPSYLLGHSDHELDRLRTQARLLEPVTRQFLREAGITHGMRVLDVGSGTGEVAFLTAELVGPNGFVVGTDTAPTAVAAATRAAQSRGLRNVEFRGGDPAELELDPPFDAVVGRYVLPFQGDPAMMLRRLARLLRRGGLLFFHEPDFTFVRSTPSAPLYEQACRWIVDTSRLSGQSWNFLDRVHPTFERAKLPAPTLRLRTFIAIETHAHEWLMAVGDMVESLLPAMERLGVATAEDVDLPTLRDRLWEEATATPRMIIGRSEIGIWTNVV